MDSSQRAVVYSLVALQLVP